MRYALSLVELLVVALIVGLLAALAVPQLTRGEVNTSDPGVRRSLTVLRNAIELYYYDHGRYPGQSSDGTHAAGSAEAFCWQLTRFTGEGGSVSQTRDARFCFGPYLRAGIPPCPVSPRLGMTGVAMLTSTPAYCPSAPQAGWVYNYQTGDIVVNSDAKDPDGVPYDTY